MERTVLEDWNALSTQAAAEAILPCCGSVAWAWAMTERRPVSSADTLLATSAEVWRSLPPEDWEQAFRSHPRIGERKADPGTTARSLAWSTQEQKATESSESQERLRLGDANRAYEQRFGRIFLICASGRSTGEILTQIEIRMQHDAVTEVQISGVEQGKITDLRLRRWLSEGVV